MKRRILLAAAGTGLLGGCLGRSSVGAPEQSKTTTDDPPLTRPTGTPETTDANGAAESGSDERRVSLAGVDDVPAKHAITIDVELLEETVTPDHTARLRVTTTNEGERRRLSVSEGRCNLFNRSGGASETPGLWLHRPKSREWIEREGDRWTRNRDADEPRGYLMYGCGARSYDSGESVASDYLVWDDYREEGYMEPGTYRFGEDVLVRSADETPSADTKLAEFVWGFDLRVERR